MKHLGSTGMVWTVPVWSGLYRYSLPRAYRSQKQTGTVQSILVLPRCFILQAVIVLPSSLVNGVSYGRSLEEDYDNVVDETALLWDEKHPKICSNLRRNAHKMCDDDVIEGSTWIPLMHDDHACMIMDLKIRNSSV